MRVLETSVTYVKICLKNLKPVSLSKNHDSVTQDNSQALNSFEFFRSTFFDALSATGLVPSSSITLERGQASLRLVSPKQNQSIKFNH